MVTGRDASASGTAKGAPRLGEAAGSRVVNFQRVPPEADQCGWQTSAAERALLAMTYLDRFHPRSACQP